MPARGRNPAGPPGPGQPTPEGQPRAGAAESSGNQLAGGNNPALAGGDKVKMEDINLDVGGGNEERKQPPGTNIHRNPPQAQRKDSDDEGDAEDFDGYDDESLPFFSQIVNRYPKSINWYFMVLAFAAARAATSFGVTLAYLSLIGRIVQVVGAFTNKPIVCYIGFGISAFVLTILYFVAMAHEAD
jgi:hypothetical protein